MKKIKNNNDYYFTNRESCAILEPQPREEASHRLVDSTERNERFGKAGEF